LEDNKSILGLVIVDGVGFRNFILSNFLKEAQTEFDEIVIYSGLPKKVYSGFTPPNCVIEELDDFKETSKTWIYRKAKEIAHLYNNRNKNFGIQDNLKANYPNTWNKRGIITRLLFMFTRFFHSEKWIARYYKLQQKSFNRHPTTLKAFDLFEKHKPDLLFFTHQRPPFIAPLLYAAENKGILTASFIFSWDNLASKGRMAGDFDFYLVWSELMKKELKQFYNNIKGGQISVVGTPQFEPYVLKRYSMEREQFLKRFDLDGNQQTICYSCGDVSTSKNDALYIETIAQGIENNAFGKPLNFLVRTSPAEEDTRFRFLMEKYPNIKWNTPQWDLSREGHTEPWSQRVPTIQDMKDLRAILAYCDVGINMCSTMSLDFMHFDKPVINPVFGTGKNGLYNDRRFLKYAHYRRVVESGAVQIAGDEQALIRSIIEAIESPFSNHKQREALLALQVGKPLKGTGKRIAQQLNGL
jgi:hypothetical protein